MDRKILFFIILIVVALVLYGVFSYMSGNDSTEGIVDQQEKIAIDNNIDEGNEVIDNTISENDEVNEDIELGGLI